MHIAIDKFIEGFNAQGARYDLQPGSLTSGRIKLEVSPSTDAAEPTAFRLEFPSPLEIGEAMYPMFLLMFTFGKQLDIPALMTRQAEALRRSDRYTEQRDGWTYLVYSSGSRWHMEVAKA